MAEGDELGLGVPEGDVLVEGDHRVATLKQAVALLEVVLLGDASHLVGDAVHGEKPTPAVATRATCGFQCLLEKRLGILRDEPVLPRPVGHLLDAGVVDVAGGQALPQVLLDGGDVLLVHLNVQFAEDLVHTAGAGRRLQHQLRQVLAVEDLAQHVEDLVASECLTDLVELLEEPHEDLTLARVLGHQVEDEHLTGLAVAVDAAHPLLQPVRVPGDVVVDHQVAELQVDALAGRLGGDQHLGLVLEDALGRDPVLQTHPAVDGAHRVAPSADALLQVRECVSRLSEDQYLGSGMLAF